MNKAQHAPKVEKLEYHRNGVGGLGFHVGIIDDPENGRLLAVRFPKTADKETGGVVCAVFNLNKLGNEIIEFGANSWRGDHYSDLMDEAIAKAEEGMQS